MDENSPKPVFLFRVDAGPQIGLGHLQRCLSLAAASKELGVASVFVVNGGPVVEERVTASGCDAVGLDGTCPGGAEDLQRTLATAARYRCDAVIVDRYNVTVEYLERLRASGVVVAVIDDLAGHPFPCHLVFNGGAHADTLPYRSSSGDTAFLLGPPYALLRPEFRDLAPRPVRDPAQNVLVTLGGTDSHNLMPKLIRLVDSFRGSFSVTAVVGPFFKNRAEIELATRDCRRPARLVDAPDSLCDLMMEADLAISAGGQTVFELLRSGCPVVAVGTAENQRHNLEALAVNGIVRLAGWARNGGVLENVRTAVKELLEVPTARAALNAAGRKILDGRGALRVSRRILRTLRAMPTCRPLTPQGQWLRTHSQHVAEKGAAWRSNS